MNNIIIFFTYFLVKLIINVGFIMIITKPSKEGSQAPKPANHSTNFLVGLMTSMSNPKVILFYFSFFPAFFDIETLSLIDIAALFLIATFSVGAVMAGYAYVAAKTRSSLAASPKTQSLKIASGALLMSGGVFIALRSYLVSG